LENQIKNNQKEKKKKSDQKQTKNRKIRPIGNIKQNRVGEGEISVVRKTKRKSE
jgi:hypothetical protein